MKICAECKWFERSENEGFDRCLHGMAVFVDMIRGRRLYKYCSTMREFESNCGQEARYWEPRLQEVA